MRQLIDGRRAGIGRVLAGALGTLVVLPLLAALVGGISLRAARAPIAEMSSVNVRFSTDYSQIIAATIELERLLVSTGSNQSVANEAAYRGEVEVSLNSLISLVENADYPFLDGPGKDELHRSAQRISNHAEAIIRNRNFRRDQDSAITEALEELEKRARNIERLTREWSAAQPRGDDRNLAIEQLGKLRFWATTLAGLANAAPAATSAGDLATTESRYATSLRSAIFDLSTLSAEISKEEFASDLDVLYERGRGKDNIFALAGRQLQAQRGIGRSQQDLADEFLGFLNLMETLAVANNQLARDSLQAADNALQVSWLTLMVAVSLGLVIALVVSKRYVYNRIVLRLRGLSATTRRLSGGDLSTEVAIDGNDEITDLQSAVIVFRENARALDERERVLEARTIELETANQDLDNFAYVASHDLRAPLRAIDTLASFLIQDIGDDLPSESARHLEMMRNRIVRLESLLVGLLEYSRIGRKELAAEEIDLDQVVRRSAELVLPDDFRLKITGEYPHVVTPVAPIEQVVRNLVDNAAKHCDRDSGEIWIDGSLKDGEYTLKVKDDGPGIDQQYHERIFGLFQTLRSRDDVEGSGLGLALLRKSIESLGGSISVASDPERSRGTEFTVRWPVGQKEEVALAG